MRRSPTGPHPQVQPYSYVNSVDEEEVRWGEEADTNTLRGSACRLSRIARNTGDPLVTSVPRGVTTRLRNVSCRGADPVSFLIPELVKRTCVSGVSRSLACRSGERRKAVRRRRDTVRDGRPGVGPGASVR